jgi:phosphoadenosine phosphosulfate reductase
MPMVRLGKMPLRWCSSCDLPVLERSRCNRCGGPTYKVPVTPPGDIRPAFSFDIEMVREELDKQFGPGCGRAVIPDGRILLLSRSPSLDRMDDVVMGGRVIGSLVFDIDRLQFRFIPRMDLAQAIVLSGKLARGWVKMDIGAIPSVMKGANGLAPGIIAASKDVVPGDEVLVLDPEGKAVAVGSAKMAAEEMLRNGRGTAVKTRWYGPSQPLGGAPATPLTWKDVLDANRHYINDMVARAVNFVKWAVSEQKLPVAVSYSGGKDSLVTLLLVLESDIKPKVIFVDTGLELEETVKNVHDTCKQHDLELLEEKAGDAFWESLPHFGPPSRDFRWCCKTCKLGPISRLIKQHFPQGVLTFIGQRAYESVQRQGKGAIWRNPWVAAQVGASPIQEWPALLVWLYLFDRNAAANPLYSQGHARIGCWLCPASDLGDMRLLSENKDKQKLDAFIGDYANKRGLSEIWTSKALWRWRRLPNGLSKYEKDFTPTKQPPPQQGALKLVLAEGYNPCTGGISVEGAFTSTLDMERVSNILHCVGKVRPMDEKSGAIIVMDAIDVFPEGAIVVRGKDERELNRRVEDVRKAIVRAMGCVGCGVCLGRCPKGAVTLVNGKATINIEVCESCGLCSDKCPVTDFVDEKTDELDF